MLLKITKPDEVDDKKLMSVYSEGNIENADYFYPQLEDKTEAVKKVEADFCNYIKTEFLNGKNRYYVWVKDGLWVSALRLYLVEDNFYYLEALETAPEERKKGYATELLNSVIADLQKAGSFKICDCVSRKNAASLNTHKKCGFRIVSERGYDYLQKQHEEHCYGLEYSFPLVFRKPDGNDIDEITAFKQEFTDCNSGMDGTGILVRASAEEWLKFNSEMETTDNPNYAKSLQYGLFDGNRLLGLIQIRLELKGYLIEFGGHIGYCVRPSERKKGYAKQMLKCALNKCKEIGLKKVLITCLENNIASEKTILSCGGIFEKTVFDDKNYQANLKRFWIEL